MHRHAGPPNTARQRRALSARRTAVGFRYGRRDARALGPPAKATCCCSRAASATALRRSAPIATGSAWRSTPVRDAARERGAKPPPSARRRLRPPARVGRWSFFRTVARADAAWTALASADESCKMDERLARNPDDPARQQTRQANGQPVSCPAGLARASGDTHPSSAIV